MGYFFPHTENRSHQLSHHLAHLCPALLFSSLPLTLLFVGDFNSVLRGLLTNAAPVVLPVVNMKWIGYTIMNYVAYCHVERWWAPMLTQINSKNKFHREYRQMVYGGALSTEWLLISSSSRKTWFDWHNTDLGQWVKFLDVFKQPCVVLSTKASGASSKAGRVPSHVFIKSGLYTRFKVQQFRQTTHTWDLRRCYLTFLWKGGYLPCSRRKTNGSHKAKWESFGTMWKP